MNQQRSRLSLNHVASEQTLNGGSKLTGVVTSIYVPLPKAVRCIYVWQRAQSKPAELFFNSPLQ
jgi:hypothetical protein